MKRTTRPLPSRGSFQSSSSNSKLTTEAVGSFSSIWESSGLFGCSQRHGKLLKPRIVADDHDVAASSGEVFQHLQKRLQARLVQPILKAHRGLLSQASTEASVSVWRVRSEGEHRIRSGLADACPEGPRPSLGQPSGRGLKGDDRCPAMDGSSLSPDFAWRKSVTVFMNNPNRFARAIGRGPPAPANRTASSAARNKCARLVFALRLLGFGNRNPQRCPRLPAHTSCRP